MLNQQTFETCKLMPGYVVIQPEPPKDSAGLISLSWGSQSPNMHGVVINAGDSKDVSAGDTVVFERWTGAHYEMPDRSDLVLVKHGNLLAVVS